MKRKTKVITLCSIAILVAVAVVVSRHIGVQFENHYLIYAHAYSSQQAAQRGHLISTNVTVTPSILPTPRGDISLGESWVEGGKLRVSPLFFVRTPWSHHRVPNERYHLCFSIVDAPAGLDYMFRFRNMQYGSPLIQPDSVHEFDVSEEIQTEYEGYLIDREDNILPKSDFKISVPADVLRRIRGEANQEIHRTQ